VPTTTTCWGSDCLTLIERSVTIGSLIDYPTHAARRE
jgi:hypothetical protein